MDDLNRLRHEYDIRDRRLENHDIYSPFNCSYLFARQSRQRNTLSLIRENYHSCLDNAQILELGCGRGGELIEFLSYGATLSHLHGIDLLFNRVQDAHRILPHLPLTCADGQNLPYAGSVFNLVLQYTVLSSILDDNIKQNLANEMLRVLKPDGFILWYDFWLNPTNPHARGIRPAEIRRLFPGCRFVFRRITLAPPVARRLVPLSWMGCLFLEKLRIFNSHYLVAIRPDH